MCVSLNNDACGALRRSHDGPCSEGEGVLRGSKSMPVGEQDLLQSPGMINMCEFLQDDEVVDDEKSVVHVATTISAETSVESVESNQSKKADQRYRHIALDILEGTFIEIPYKEYANFLGSEGNHRILTEFIKLLDPLPLSLLEALSNLSNSIYFIAEAQNIDRTLECLSKEWIQCHPDTHWKSSYKLCHIVLFSLLILNSDLHNDFQIDHKKTKFSMVAFINNTLRALREESEYEELEICAGEHLIIDELSEYYKLLNETPLPLLTESETSIATSEYEPSLNRFSTLGSREYSISNLRGMASSSTTLYPRDNQNSIREVSAKSNRNFHNNKPMQTLYCKEPFDDDLVSDSGSSWFVDGLVSISKKSLPNRFFKRDRDQETTPKVHSKRSFFGWLKPSKSKTFIDHTSRTTSLSYLSKDSEWDRVKVQIREGRMLIFKIKQNVKDIHQSNGTNSTAIDYYKEISSSYFAYSLFEAEAQVVQDNIIIGCEAVNINKNAKKKKGNFTVIFPEDINGPETVLEFQTKDIAESHKFTQCINFWAGRISPVPMTQFELVSNEEYGWSDKVFTDLTCFDLKQTTISEWKPLLGLELLYEDSKDMETKLKDRLEELMDFTKQLGVWIDRHNEIKDKLVEIWSFDENCFEVVMNNWNSKYLYMNTQYKKRLTYLEALQKAMESVPLDI
ncbi:hypothetical protein SEUBUCD646_0B00610 [Saccharomyces eubayanus]|uniref:Guanine-nucleotide exchange factor YEL1 n=2 Tax=Saccharomyces TaxID=4930 RepID=A0ABN8VMW5_SACEU|nr:YEL1-like protein [Saccharomyces eubayanus]KOH00786.1 YEL1-like protein [Saccharomyces eubayanus]CAI1804296.1 hypothetical protein SEUBUCD650_0B00630 [Saccharomyces eubayanus]CAI1840509.1 hypothetical protein SEUBUCD646_0B00610 [Saccharomyces eubayanus]